MSAARTGGAALLLAAAVLLGGCGVGQPSLYTWQGYEQGLGEQFINSDPAAALTAYEAALTDIQQRNGRVPPGLYGDYGFLLYLRGDAGGAVAAFRREKELFPESTALMDRLIARVEERQAGATPRAGVPAPTPPYASTDSRAPGERPTPTATPEAP